MPAPGAITHQITLKNSSGYSILPVDIQNLLAWTTTYSSRAEVLQIGVTTSPTATTINGLAGTSPVTAIVYNNSASDLTVLGVAGFTQTVRAGKAILLDQFVTTSNITLSVASGTGEAVVVLLD